MTPSVTSSGYPTTGTHPALVTQRFSKHRAEVKRGSDYQTDDCADGSDYTVTRTLGICSILVVAHSVMTLFFFRNQPRVSGTEANRVTHTHPCVYKVTQHIEQPVASTNLLHGGESSELFVGSKHSLPLFTHTIGLDVVDDRRDVQREVSNFSTFSYTTRLPYTGTFWACTPKISHKV